MKLYEFNIVVAANSEIEARTVLLDLKHYWDMDLIDVRDLPEDCTDINDYAHIQDRS